MGLFKKKEIWKPEERGGIVVGYDSKKKIYYFESDTKHSLITGVTGSGKTKRVFIPSILTAISYGDSFIANDTKKELYYTLKTLLEEKGYDVLLIDYRFPEFGQRYNFMDDVIHNVKAGKDDEAQMESADLVATLLPRPKTGEPMWTDGARSAIEATILGLAVSEDIPQSAKNISNVFYNIMKLGRQTGKTTPIDEYFKSGERSYIETVAYGNYGMSSSKVRMSFNSLATSSIREFTYKKITKQTSMSDFNIRDYAQKDSKPVAIFVVNPDEKETLERLSTTFIEAMYRKLTEESNKMPGSKLPRRWHFYLDEFTNMGKLKDFSKRLTVSRGRNIIYHLGVQADKMLDSTYGKDDADVIRKNTSVKVWLTAPDTEDRKFIQEAVGQESVIGTNKNKRERGLFDLSISKDSLSLSSKKKQLISTEFLTLMGGVGYEQDAVVKKTGMFAFKTKLPFWMECNYAEFIKPISYEDEIERKDDETLEYWKLLPVEEALEESGAGSQDMGESQEVNQTQSGEDKELADSVSFLDESYEYDPANVEYPDYDS
ncbi:type IV secretory system conjugative DNA transfer family protein [Erysipelothrix sp. HDW6A]|uniref:type IV secretory system conjugative DNA transfer family protein n=1 Tax=Erysipelothrix sp. HDW6A TaxID=2714928 RepID=UPI00140B325E|nr:type IV secretory system conjugative DNA transfer family protein [Erysipelothrix sp. HDW6A]QIK57019.1 type IV secretory system conjugative DNA transfer family protein [Erysipelothrix sp. HDW6A]